MKFNKKRFKFFRYRHPKTFKLLVLGIFTIIMTFVLILINALPINIPALQSKLDEPIKWVDFNVPYKAMEKAMYLDIESYETEVHLKWTELLAYLGAKYGGNFRNYKAKDLDSIANKLKNGESIEEITNDMKYYNYYLKAYTAILGGFLGEYKIQVPIKNDEGEYGDIMWVEKYGLKAFSPIPEGYWYNDYDDFGAGRSYGYDRKHFGHDLMISTGTPIIAVESGIVEAMGWNQYGGWRIGIRSFDKQRYYYYAHLRKDRPYSANLYVGKAVKAGDVIGYSGRTGYSRKENVNNIDTPHLHYGMQLIFDESLKDSPNQIWIDLYDITKLLSKNRCSIFKNEETKEYYRKYDISEPSIYLEDQSAVSAAPEGSTPLPIIMYHGLTKNSSYQNNFNISPKTFEKDLKYLKENSYTPIFIKDLINYVDNGTPLPEKPIVLTFDDGHYNNYLYAYPLLREYDMKAVISIIGKYTDKFSDLKENNALYSYLTWHQINDMIKSGHVEIQNHSYNMHVNRTHRQGILKKAYESYDDYTLILQEDIGFLQSRIKEMTGQAPNTFTYPFGFVDDASEDTLKSMGFRATLSCAEGINHITRDPECLFHLKRILRPPDITSKEFFKSIAPAHTSP